jgi:large subunit ribosomal protein L10
MAKELKQIIVDEMTQRYSGLDRCIVVNFSGVSSLASGEIRRRLREQNINFKVVKNSLMARAFKQVGLEKLVGLLEGPCAVAIGGEDVVQLAKAVAELADKNKKLVIRGGYGEGMVLGLGEVRRFATIAPRPVLIAQLLGTAQAPLSRMVGALGGVTQKFVGTLDAVAKTKPPMPVPAAVATTPEAAPAPGRTRTCSPSCTRGRTDGRPGGAQGAVGQTFLSVVEG